jgi:hypothetical protein
MQESKLFGTPLPSSPDFLAVVRAVREKYGLPELSPDDEWLASKQNTADWAVYARLGAKDSNLYQLIQSSARMCPRGPRREWAARWCQDYG